MGWDRGLGSWAGIMGFATWLGVATLRTGQGDTSHLIYFDVSAIRPIFRKGRASAIKVVPFGQ